MVEAGWYLSSCTKEKGGELKPDCPHPWLLVDWHPSFHSVDPVAIDNLDNGLKRASFRLHDEKKYDGRQAMTRLLSSLPCPSS